MRVTRIINSLDFGGIEKVLEIVAKYHKGDKQELLFVALGKGGSAERVIKDFGYRVIVLNERTTIPNFRLILKLCRIIRTERPTVVHTCGAEANFHGLIAGKLTGVGIRIGEEIGIPAHGIKAQLVFRQIYRTSSAVIAVANAVARYLIEKKEVKREKLHVIYNPVDVDKFINRERTKSADFIFIAVCRLHPIKNLSALLRAFARLCERHSSIKLWLVGDGEERYNLESTSAQLGIKERVVFWGYQPDPSAFLNGSSAFVLPSFSEGHPVSMIEAMLARVPVIVTKVGGAPELITHGESGWLIDPRNDNEILGCLEQAMELSEEKRVLMVDKACATVLDKFSPAQYLNNLNKLYLSLL